MREAVLGRTGIRTSVLGLGAGGPSRIGRSYEASEEDSVRLVREAVDMGIRFFDTAEVYGTESIVGRALRDLTSKDEPAVSTKLMPTVDGRLKREPEIGSSLHGSLERLGLERVDVYHVHGVRPETYDAVRDRIFPVLDRFREQGKIRAVGITEHFGTDTGHRMLDAALSDDLWDVIMVGFNMFNPSARGLLARASSQGVGVLDMFAVRRAFRSLDEVERQLAAMAESGAIDSGLVEAGNPIAECLRSGECASTTEMAYRFCLHEPGIDVVLSGTGSIEHLRENRKAAELPPLSDHTRERLGELFGGVDTVSGN